jgi:hypothetical protein
MSHTLQVSVSVLLLAAALVGAGFLDPQQLARMAADVQHLPAYLRTLTDCHDQMADVDRQLEAFWVRQAARREVVAELVERRLTLPEAAARFRDLNAKACSAGHVRLFFPGRTEEESICRHLIFWAQCELESDAPSVAQEVAARLEAELNEHLRRHGTIPLPD